VPGLALGLVIAAAAFHAGWNLLLKQVEEKYIVTWWSVMLSALLALPVMLGGGLPRTEAWPYLITSALIEAAYMATLAAAYNLSDFSLVYPIARGAAPAFLALWAVLLLGERPTALGAAGLALVVFGLMLVGSNALLLRGSPATTGPAGSGGNPGGGDRAGVRLAGVALALGTALLISIYSTLDGAAVKLTPATPYTVVLLGLSGVFFTPFAVRGKGWRKTLRVGRAHWRRVLAIGVLGLLAYTLALNAYAIAQVSYAGAIREVSIVFAALAGWKLLGEPMGRVRVIGSLVIFAGIVLIALS
jgi:drug/metabolite transporter (DMT)-like permease